MVESSEQIFRDMNMIYPSTPKHTGFKSFSSSVYDLDDASHHQKTSYNNGTSAVHDYSSDEDSIRQYDTRARSAKKQSIGTSPIKKSTSMSPSKNYKSQMDNLRTSPVKTSPKKQVRMEEEYTTKPDAKWIKKYAELSNRCNDLDHKLGESMSQCVTLLDENNTIKNQLNSLRKKYDELRIKHKQVDEEHTIETNLVKLKLQKYFMLHKKCQQEHGKLSVTPKIPENASREDKLKSIIQQLMPGLDKSDTNEEDQNKTNINKSNSQEAVDEFLRLINDRLRTTLPNPEKIPIKEQAVEANPQLNTIPAPSAVQREKSTTPAPAASSPEKSTSEQTNNEVFTKQQMNELIGILKNKQEDSYSNDFVLKEDLDRILRRHQPSEDFSKFLSKDELIQILKDLLKSADFPSQKSLKNEVSSPKQKVSEKRRTSDLDEGKSLTQESTSQSQKPISSATKDSVNIEINSLPEPGVCGDCKINLRSPKIDQSRLKTMCMSCLNAKDFTLSITQGLE